MKRVFIFLLSLYVSKAVLSQNRFELSGYVDTDSVTITMSFIDSLNSEKTVKPIKGKFKFRGKLSQDYEYVSLVLRKSGEYVAGWSFFITSGKMKVTLGNHKLGNSYKINYKNVPFFAEKERADSILANFEEKRMATGAYLSKLKLSEQGNEDSIMRVLNELKNDLVRTKVSFIQSNVNSYFNFYFFKKEIVDNFIASLRITPDSLHKLYMLFPESFKATRTGLLAKEEINKRLSLTIGNIVPSFTFSDSSFNTFSTKDLIQKKSLLLCFWDAGCKPCIASFPTLKSLYDAYRDNLEIISVSLDINETKWKTTLKKYNLPWFNICNIEKYTSQNLSALYNVQYIPQYFLIDKSGNLIYHNVQSEDTEDYFILKKLLSSICERNG